MATRMKRAGYIVARAACCRLIRVVVMAYIAYALIEHYLIHHSKARSTKRVVAKHFPPEAKR